MSGRGRRALPQTRRELAQALDGGTVGRHHLGELANHGVNRDRSRAELDGEICGESVERLVGRPVLFDLLSTLRCAFTRHGERTRCRERQEPRLDLFRLGRIGRRVYLVPEAHTLAVNLR
jgi:hypothetical protein